MNHLAKSLVILLLTALTNILGAQNPGDTITITGHITNHPHVDHPPTTITATDAQTGQALGQTHTDQNGLYQLQIITDTGTNITEHNHNQQPMQVVPNPFALHAILRAYLPAPGNYTITATDLYGRTLYTQAITATTGLNHIPIQLPLYNGMVAVTLQNPQFHQTTKAIQLPGIQSQPTQQTTNIYPVETQSEYSNREEQGIRNKQSRLRPRNGNEKQTTNKEQRTRNTEKAIIFIFQSPDHQDKDTTLTWQNHDNINMTLQVIPEDVLANYALNATNNPMNAPIQNGQVQVTNEHGEELIQQNLHDGTTQSTFPQTEWIYQNDTIRHTNELTTNINAENHHEQELFNLYKKNLDIETTLEQIKQTQTNNVNVQATNNQMNAPVQGLTIEAYTNNNDLIGVFNENNFDINREFYSNGTDTLPDFETVKFVLKAPHHQDSDTINKPYTTNMNLDAILEQTPYNQDAELNMNFTSEPLGYAPNLEAAILNNEDEIAQTTTPNGEATITIPYTEYINGEDTLKLINGAPVNELTIKASNDKHIKQTYNTPFQNEMNITETIDQTPEQRTTTITTNLEGNIFNEAPNGVNLTYKNNETNELLTQNESTNGTNTAEIEYNYWQHEDLTHQDLNEIKQEITKPGVYEAQTHILENQDQTTNYTLTQIPENKTATITGTVTNTNNEPIYQANTEIKHEETTHATTTTTSTGTFETTMPYTKYTNPENQEQTQTNPANIHAKINKDTYQTTTTQPQNLEDLVDFGQITLTPEPIIKTLNFTAKHIQVTGDPQHPQNQYEITFGDQTHTYTIGENNEININLTAEITNGNDKVTIRNIPYEASPNTPIDNDVVMIAHQNRPAFERAFAANSPTTFSKYSNDYRRALEVDLEQINNKHNLEVLSMRNYFVNGQDFFGSLQADTIFMNTAIPLEILGIKSSGWNMHWEPYNQNGTIIDKVQFVHVKVVKQTNNLMPSIVTEPWNYAINLTTQASYRRDGQPTLQYEVLEFDSFNDPAYIEISNRTPAFRNTGRIEYDNTVSMATNGNSYLAGGLIATGIARSPPNNLSTRNTGEEVLEFIYSMANPITPDAQGASSASYLLKYDDEGNITTTEMGDFLILYRQQFPKAKQFSQPPPTK